MPSGGVHPIAYVAPTEGLCPAHAVRTRTIEKAYSKLKAYLRKIAERTVAGLMRALENCAHIFLPAQCVNYFKACGYDTD